MDARDKTVSFVYYVPNAAPIDFANRHCDGFSNIVTYHGHGREGDAKALANSDIVLSTYHTISHEASDKESPLWQIKWFRIVLDEGKLQITSLRSSADFSPQHTLSAVCQQSSSRL